MSISRSLFAISAIMVSLQPLQGASIVLLTTKGDVFTYAVGFIIRFAHSILV
jgi:hypothetical protein